MDGQTRDFGNPKFKNESSEFIKYFAPNIPTRDPGKVDAMTFGLTRNHRLYLLGPDGGKSINIEIGERLGLNSQENDLIHVEVNSKHPLYWHFILRPKPHFILKRSFKDLRGDCTFSFQ
jgi:hypothetical protein